MLSPLCIPHHGFGRRYPGTQSYSSLSLWLASGRHWSCFVLKMHLLPVQTTNWIYPEKTKPVRIFVDWFVWFLWDLRVSLQNVFCEFFCLIFSGIMNVSLCVSHKVLVNIMLGKTNVMFSPGMVVLWCVFCTVPDSGSLRAKVQWRHTLDTSCDHRDVDSCSASPSWSSYSAPMLHIVVCKRQSFINVLINCSTCHWSCSFTEQFQSIFVPSDSCTPAWKWMFSVQDTFCDWHQWMWNWEKNSLFKNKLVEVLTGIISSENKKTKRKLLLDDNEVEKEKNEF